MVAAQLRMPSCYFSDEIAHMRAIAFDSNVVGMETLGIQCLNSAIYREWLNHNAGRWSEAAR